MKKEVKPEADPTSPARRWLAEHLESVKQKREWAAEVAAQWRRLGYIKDAETSARAKVEAVRAQDVRELAEQLVNPTGLHVVSAHDALNEAEWELNRARRDADIARGCEAEVVARQTEAVNDLARAERETLRFAAAVLVEEAPKLAAEIVADTERLRAKHARLWGLRRFVGETDGLRKMLDGLPAPIHPENALPSPAAVLVQEAAWRALATRLSIDPMATLSAE